MNILGIETSCDETAASVVVDGQRIFSNVVSSSLKDHQKYGGIIPEIASRRQMELINTVVTQALCDAGLNLDKIDAVSVTKSPGLIGSLLVGVSFARALSFALDKPIIEVDHVKAHLYANFLRFENSIFSSQDKKEELPALPAIGLVVSGGHSSLFCVKEFNHFILLGQTRDDAVGEAYDKVARILGLGYPGGPVIDRLAKEGENKEVHFPCAQLPNTLDFSFSGIKTAVLYHHRRKKTMDEVTTKKVAYAFQKSVVAVVIEKCIAACTKKKIKTLLVGGGVAANSALRRGLELRARQDGIKVFVPPLSLCTDNAAMIAGLAYHSFIKKREMLSGLKNV